MTTIIIIATISIIALFTMAIKTMAKPMAYEIKSKDGYTITRVFTKEEANEILKKYSDCICNKVY